MSASRNAQGFALLLAILALLLVSALGLTLVATTAAEVEMAANYRASQQALYEADAGIEAGKRLLRDLDWDTLLPAPRYPAWTTAATPPSLPAPPLPGATRNFENGSCDKRGGRIGYGVVLNDGRVAYENQTALFGQTLPGGFTLWIRRPLVRNQDGTFSDYVEDNDHLVLTAEGSVTLPRSTGGTPPRAIRVLEVTLSRTHSVPCDTRSAQAGAGADGTGFDVCVAVDDESLPPMLSGGPALKQIDPNQN